MNTLLLRPASLATRIAQTLHDDILAGRYGAGARLPAEASLAEAFGVSRPIVREAIAQLKADGVLVTRKGSGAYVSETPGGQAWRVASAPDGGPTLAQLFELRRVVETACAEMAAQRRTGADVEAIRAALAAMQAQADGRGDMASAAATDMAFHHAIAEAAHNPCFTGLTDFVGQQMLAARQRAWENTARLSAATGVPRAADHEHAALAEAIAAGDATAARNAAQQHLTAAAARLGLPA
ncbi:FadR/GntR family transcriptional regulator [Cupriavidus taiwanensis]|uniref:FadR/GntR family transcriptional regulator n=1 Tax=Cupriavidus taiwanensis TaxID=164546 RepID=UPI000E1060D9|nr:FCD domain-containing protein [Cupriavidus taiwanensis]SOY56613.1 putative transcriptional regulator, GntR family [Cupriavidus taiwanensis]SOY57369.1 putative transcriptional regulator, GntR family [Cupriavidus taiwanensis]SOY79376.1 putative transcriptional regulator, GntR family [Cupriavidus taiwanensis]SOZ65284.1 putative transcriptional regulator, GntR family [Cupriavidus taiwanensis]SOZ76547.1 putative transcriptional regulator, GntR family [Cupriavidus taiwanensis]